MRAGGIIAAAILAASLAACGAQPHAAARCASPAMQADGTYSSYRTAGTMPDGTSRRMDDGDTWQCRNGSVTVVSS